ncbi:histidine kinase [Mucilaginibacter antarcticus]|uniref:histidine kinase n=1 Tax=Mucilaginibacter antarcticus TaxID=1855725 RepID=UPI00363F0471
MTAYLQQQISPHLLFNTLTFIHNTYYKHSRTASQCVLLLVDIMRFSLEEVDIKGKTTLKRKLHRSKISLSSTSFGLTMNYISILRWPEMWKVRKSFP